MIYEGKVGKRIERLFPDAERIYSGWWFNWEDGKGRSWCQPDFIVIDDGFCWVFESKRTYTERAWKQLELYKGLCSHHFGLSTLGVTAVQHLGKGKGGALPNKVLDPFDALEMDKDALWHYRPR